MKNLRFYGYHGLLPEEKKLGQEFILDVKLYLKLEEAGRLDSISETVDYGAVYNLIKDLVTGESFNLIEGLGEHICAQVFKQFMRVEKIVLTVKKPCAPINGLYDYVGVEIERNRK